MTELMEVSSKMTKSALTELLGDTVEFDKPMAPLTTYGTGGPARYFLEATSAEQLSLAVRVASDLKVPFFVIGGGSNLLVSDAGYDGLIVKVAVMGLTIKEATSVECGAGEELMALVDFATESGLTGLEFAAGIWGTVGGAVYGNAGAYGGEMKDVVTGLRLIDQKGDLRSVGPEYCRFGYRDSHLKRTREIIVDVTLSLSQGNKADIERRVKEILSLRETKHPTGGKSAGCFFKNILDPNEEFGKLPAGRLLDEAGVKGLSVGGAEVFDKHANMIVNTGKATSKDIRRLADIMKEKVMNKFGIELEEEVIQLGEF
jgi:UDP-N-acetylmuramate dehydrogenase